MPELLLITGDRDGAVSGGRAQLSRLHRDCLSEIFGHSLAVHSLDTGSAVSRTAGLRGYVDGQSPELVRQIVDRLRAKAIPRLFLDGSNLGRIAAGVKQALPRTEIFTFCHNVEARFFMGALRRRPRPHAAGVLFANYVAERLAVRHSDRLIALNERDSAGFKRLYGRAATDLLPMAMRDQLPPGTAEAGDVAPDAYALFVGGAFYANQQGIAWYAREVAPHLTLPTVVVGKGMEAMRDELERAPNMQVVGAVDSLAEWYRNARVAIAPIFDGSGMKTKIAEALMFGKPVAGTSEAFVGYEPVAEQAGWVCDTPQAFVAAMKEAQLRPIKTLDRELRGLYERDYSYGAALTRLRQILSR